MGNTDNSEKKSDEQLQNYLSSLIHVRKEHSISLGRDIDLYKKMYPDHPEELILLYEITFDEAEDSNSNEEQLNYFKKDINLRKKLDSLYLSQMLFINFKVLDGLCVNKIQCRMSFQFSDYTLAKYINETRVLRASQMNMQYVSPQ